MWTDTCWDQLCKRVGASELILDVDIEVRQSPGKGDGLFALRQLKPGTLVGRYTGVTRTLAQHKRIREEDGSNGLYSMKLGTEWVLDAEEAATSGCMRFVNHSIRRQNCEVVPTDIGLLFDDPSDSIHDSIMGAAARDLARRCSLPHKPFAIFFETTHTVAAGDELFIDYGHQYWESATSFARTDPRQLAIDYL